VRENYVVLFRYLKPLERDEEKEKRAREQLKDLRNNVCGGMALVNLVWIAINFMFQLRSPTVVTIKLPVGCVLPTSGRLCAT
jgi:hypothetical protein